MNGNNIKLYKLLKNNLQMADNKAGEFVDVLDAIIQSDIKDSAMEYKSFVKEELVEIDNRMDKLDKRLDNLDNRMDKLDAKIDKVDAKIDLRFSELSGDLRGEIKETKIDTIKWMVGIFLALALMVIGLYFKK
jgi:peptidoglycan hydrolase CwlO-like protein